MNVDPSEFRQALSRFASGVTVVSAVTNGGVPVGVTVSAFASLSLDPPLILVCLDLKTSNLDAYTAGSGFCVNVLAEGQSEVSNAFAFAGPVPPMERFPHRPGLNGVPVLDGTLASLECSLEAVHPGGDHEIVVGRVERARWSDERTPLIYATGRYRSLAENADGG